MAKIEILAPFILSFEGGFVDHKNDRGGATNKGVTIKTWKSVGYDIDGDGVVDVSDLKLLSQHDVVERVMRPHYWDRWKADQIHNQSIANILVDWAWGSGAIGIKRVQKLLGLKADGLVGPLTLSALNGYADQRELFDLIVKMRNDFLHRIVENDESQRCFLKGWLRRLNCIQYDNLILNK